MKKKLVVLLIILCMNTYAISSSAESLFQGVQLTDSNYTLDYQLFYYSLLMVDYLGEGTISTNIQKANRMVEWTEYPIDKKYSFEQDSFGTHFVAEYAFGSRIGVLIRSAGLNFTDLFQSAFIYNADKQEDSALFGFLYEDQYHAYTIDDFLTKFGSIDTVEILLSVKTPYVEIKDDAVVCIYEKPEMSTTETVASFTIDIDENEQPSVTILNSIDGLNLNLNLTSP